MPDDLNICPNCGATMQQHSFTYECEYCGTIVLKEGLSEICQKDDLESNIEEKYSYLNKNYSYFSQSKYISCVKNDNSYEIKTAISFYANDGKYNKVNDFSFSLYYKNNREAEHLNLCVYTKKFPSNPQLTILIDREFCLRPVFDETEEDVIFFNITRKELQIICESHYVQIASNCFETGMALFNEFPSFCSRFYHFTFDKRKYIYSLHKNLITDK